VNGKALRVRETLVPENPSGDELAKIQERKLRVRDTMKVEQGGSTVATVTKAIVSPLRDRFSVEVENGDDLEAKGNVLDHEFKIERGGDRPDGARRVAASALTPRRPCPASGIRTRRSDPA
jgi:uncharacterized protein YxjI